MKKEKPLVIFEKKLESWTTSLDVAEKFGKNHRHVMDKINSLIEHLPKNRQMFQDITYIDYYKREQKAYNLTRDGFSLLAMGFTGKKALRWKLKYIDAFNGMERCLKIKLKNQADETTQKARIEGKKIRIGQTDVIKKFVAYAEGQGSTKANMYYMAITKMENKALFFIAEGLPKPNNLRDMLDTFQLFQLGTADRLICKVIEEGMEKELHYKDIFQLAKKKIEQFAEIIGVSGIPLQRIENRS